MDEIEFIEDSFEDDFEEDFDKELLSERLKVAELEKELLAYKKGIDQGMVDFAIFSAEKMTNEELDFEEALDKLIADKPHLFAKKRINTGLKQSRTLSGKSELYREVFRKMGIRDR